MQSLILVSCLTLLLQTLSPAQERATILHTFFEKRLSGDQHQPVPPFDELMQAIDTIANSESKDLTATLPLLSAALKSNKENLPVEAGSRSLPLRSVRMQVLFSGPKFPK